MLCGQTALAAARLHRRLNEIGRDNLVAVPLLAQLVEVQLAQPDLGGAAETAESLATIAGRSGQARAEAEAELALGSVRAATDGATAREHLDRSLQRLASAVVRPLHGLQFRPSPPTPGQRRAASPPASSR